MKDQYRGDVACNICDRHGDCRDHNPPLIRIDSHESGEYLCPVVKGKTDNNTAEELADQGTQKFISPICAEKTGQR